MKLNELKTVIDDQDLIYNIEKQIGRGGQGAVFRLTDKSLAIKLLVDNDDNIIENEKIYNVYKDKVTDVMVIKDINTIHLCKPVRLLKKPMCGYLMQLLNTLEPLDHLLHSTTSNESLLELFRDTYGLKKRYDVLTELARTMALLHSNGLVYCDISPNNVFFAPIDKISKVWLIDCDNLRYISDDKPGIFTPGYGAPEVVNNITSNTVFSDCYSFAILLFKLLTNNHPIDSSIVANEQTASDDWDASTTVSTSINPSGYKPWVFDGIDQETKSYYQHFITPSIYNLLERTFNKSGQLLPSSRPSMREWYETLKGSSLDTSKCPSCGTYILSGESNCPFCDADYTKKNIGSIYRILPNYKNQADNVLDELEKDLNMEIPNRNSISKMQVEPLKAFVIYHDLVVGSELFSLNSINEEPKEILHFEKTNYGFYLYNISQETIGVKIGTETVEKICPNDRTHLNNGSTAKIFYVDPKTKVQYLIGVYLND